MSAASNPMHLTPAQQHGFTLACKMMYMTGALLAEKVPALPIPANATSHYRKDLRITADQISEVAADVYTNGTGRPAEDLSEFYAYQRAAEREG